MPLTASVGASSPEKRLMSVSAAGRASGEVEAWCKGVDIFTIASGDTGAALKWFLYAQDSSSRLILLEALLDKQNGAFGLTLKCDAGGAHAVVVAAFKRAAASILLQ